MLWLKVTGMCAIVACTRQNKTGFVEKLANLGADVNLRINVSAFSHTHLGSFYWKDCLFDLTFSRPLTNGILLGLFFVPFKNGKKCRTLPRLYISPRPHSKRTWWNCSSRRAPTRPSKAEWVHFFLPFYFKISFFNFFLPPPQPLNQLPLHIGCMRKHGAFPIVQYLLYLSGEDARLMEDAVRNSIFFFTTHFFLQISSLRINLSPFFFVGIGRRNRALAGSGGLSHPFSQGAP